MVCRRPRPLAGCLCAARGYPGGFSVRGRGTMEECASRITSSTWWATRRLSSRQRWSNPARPGRGQGRVSQSRRQQQGPYRCPMVDAAEPPASSARRHIVEPTSGNTGVGLVFVAAAATSVCSCVPTRSVRTSAIVPGAYGAEVVVRPTVVPPEHPDSYYNVPTGWSGEIDGAGSFNQYANPAGPQIITRPPARRSGATPTAGSPLRGGCGHPAVTSPAPAATSRRSPAARSKVVGVDPEGSVYSGGTGRPYLVEGVGEISGRPPTTRRSPTRSSPSPTPTRSTTWRLAREDGLLVGGSCGMAVVAALQVAEREGP